MNKLLIKLSMILLLAMFAQGGAIATAHAQCGPGIACPGDDDDTPPRGDDDCPTNEICGGDDDDDDDTRPDCPSRTACPPGDDDDDTTGDDDDDDTPRNNGAVASVLRNCLETLGALRHLDATYAAALGGFGEEVVVRPVCKYYRFTQDERMEFRGSGNVGGLIGVIAANTNLVSPLAEEDYVADDVVGIAYNNDVVVLYVHPLVRRR